MLSFLGSPRLHVLLHCTLRGVRLVDWAALSAEVTPTTNDSIREMDFFQCRDWLLWGLQTSYCGGRNQIFPQFFVWLFCIFRPKNEFTSRPWLCGFDQHLPRRRRVLSSQERPSWTLLQKSCQNPIKKMSPKSPAAMFSCLDINTKKRLILLCSSEFSGVQCATLEVA